MTTVTVVQPPSGAMQLVASQATPVINMEFDSSSGLFIPTGSRNSYSSTGGLYVSNRDGAGAPYAVPMLPKPVASSNSSNAAECQSDSLGWNYLNFSINGLAAVPASPTPVVGIAFSYSFNDQATVAAALTLLLAQTTGKIIVPDGALFANMDFLPLSDLSNSVSIYADPLLPIKTFMIAYNAAAAITSTNAAFGILVKGTKPA